MPNPVEKRKYLFISNVDIRNRRGGWDGLGGKIFDLLSDKLGSVRLVEKINPPISFYSKAKSKMLRVLHLPANFPAFTRIRLKRFAGLLKEQVGTDADYLIFHGSTPWVNYRPEKKYCAILDCSFITYMEKYHDINSFSKKGIERVRRKEKAFFENAHRIFFTSDWALRETRKHYGIDGANFKRIGQGPSTNVKVNTAINVPLKNQFLFIATDFMGKGGAKVCNAFQQFLKEFPDYELVIIGQRPPEIFLQGRKINFVGFINKSTAEGEAQFEKLYRETKALLMMTRKDIAPLVILEAGMFGCPCIANDVSAIGEMVRDKETGFLIGSTEEDLLKAMTTMAGMNDSEIIEMRKKATAFISNNFSWEEIIHTMIGSMSEN